MELYIGGFAQGKLDYVKRKYPMLAGTAVIDGAKVDMAGEWDCEIFNNLHLWVKRRLTEGGDPEKELEQFMSGHPDCIFICDEIGNGIVPMEHEERIYREYTGRLLCRLAERATCVERIVCGIGQRIK